MTKAYRLPPGVKPTRYDIHLHARVGDETFRGRVRIALRLEAPTDVVELHARDIRFARIRLEAGGKALEGRAEPDAEAEMAALRFPERAPAGEATLDIEYEGQVSRNMEGLYFSKAGPEEALATQCEETDARAIFPCFDEPAFKASFAWTVTTTPDVTVLANGPLAKTEEADGLRTWTFAPTKPMSSYLVALAIGKLKSTPEIVAEGVPLRVWAPEGKEALGAFGNEYAARLLPWYGEYFGAPYHFGKYDQVAVPSFSAGAMENSGLVIFRQSLLLRDPKTTSWRAEKRIALVIAHEAAHMWFGNLVTMAWWDDIWLNESFAEWMAHKAVHALSPDYRVWDDQQADKLGAMAKDALESTHPIYSPVETPEQATELFDAITYEKGAAVMRMLETFLGEEAFRAGLRTYMQEFAEANAKGGDLWRHLARASGQPVARIMESWILQGGHPVLHVALDPAGSALRVRQERFLSAPDAAAADQLWEVPVIVRYEDEAGVHVARHLLSTAEADVPLAARGPVKWAYANADGIGFYRLAMDDALLGQALANLDALTTSEQMSLLDDLWMLVRKGLRPMPRFLDALDAVLAAPRADNVLDVAAGRLSRLEDMLTEARDGAALERFRAWVRARLGPQLEALGYAPRPGEDRRDAQRRVTLLHAVAGIGRDERAIAEARRLADAELADAKSVDADLAGPAVSLAAKFGDAGRLERHVAEYERRRDAGAPPAEVGRYLNSLAAFEQPPLVRRVLELMAEGRMPLEAIGPLLRLMLGERHASEHAWEHMKRNWADVRARLGDMWTGFLVEASGAVPVRLRGDLVRFYDANLKGVAQQSYRRALEALDQRAEFERRTRDDLLAWFRRVTP